jgi:hypothetical protein
VFPDLHRRVERTHRPLEHHRDLLPPEHLEVVRVEVQHVDRLPPVSRVVGDRSPRHARRGNGVEQRGSQHRLPGTGLADDTENLVTSDLDRNVVENPRLTGIHVVRDVHVLETEDGICDPIRAGSGRILTHCGSNWWFRMWLPLTVPCCIHRRGARARPKGSPRGETVDLGTSVSGYVFVPADDRSGSDRRDDGETADDISSDVSRTRTGSTRSR